MKSILITDGDIVISSKRLQLVEDDAQKLQKTRTCLQLVQGELFYNAGVGLDYTQVLDVADGKITDDERKIAVTEALMQDENVNAINDITIETDTESRKASINVNLTYIDINADNTEDEETDEMEVGVQIG